MQDYGVYRGRNEFDFTCTEKKPIVLIGGTNGAGKTTLFESIMLCLYGISTMGKRSTKKAYNKFLTRKIHRYLKSATPADPRIHHGTVQVLSQWTGDRIPRGTLMEKRGRHGG